MLTGITATQTNQLKILDPHLGSGGGDKRLGEEEEKNREEKNRKNNKEKNRKDNKERQKKTNNEAMAVRGEDEEGEGENKEEQEEKVMINRKGKRWKKAVPG